MTAIDSNKLRELVKRMHANSLQMQEANKQNNPSYCIGWRGATNTYAIELMALIDREAAAAQSPDFARFNESLDALKDAIAPYAGTELHIRLQNVERIDHVGGDAVAAVSFNGEQWPRCIDCGHPCPPDRDPLRCLVCQLDKDAAKPDDACQLCEQEAELEPGTYTPHAHSDDDAALSSHKRLSVATRVARAWESANASSPRLTFTPTRDGLIIGARIEPQLTESQHREEKADTQED